MVRVLLLLALALLLGTGDKGNCRDVLATRHQAWDGVFENFPGRLRADVHGYAATDDCGRLGELYEVRLGQRTYRVAVADCRNRSLPARQGMEQFDLDSRVWYAAGLPNRPVEVRICLVS